MTENGDTLFEYETILYYFFLYKYVEIYIQYHGYVVYCSTVRLRTCILIEILHYN